MKRILILLALLALVSGCAWFQGSDGNAARQGGIAGVDYGTGRGTTGVSSGAGAGQGITGSDAAPPR